jgi:hypothetical protein
MSTISQAHSDAARINGAKSHGPVTPEGNARSSQNGRIHGFTASRIVFSTPEEHSDYDSLVEEYTGNLKPRGPVELDIFHQTHPRRLAPPHPRRSIKHAKEEAKGFSSTIQDMLNQFRK